MTKRRSAPRTRTAPRKTCRTFRHRQVFRTRQARGDSARGSISIHAPREGSDAFDVIASDARLWNLTDEQQARGVKRFGAALRRLSTQYDYAVIDTPPSLGGYTVAALAASDYVVAPLQVDRHAVACLRQMADTLDAIRETNEGLTFAGVLITRSFPRLKTTRVLLPLIEAEAEAMGGRVFASTVRECSALRAAEIVQLDIFRYAPKSNAAADYSAFVDELLTII